MSNIKRLKDKDGNNIYPVTHASAVFDNNGVNIINNIGDVRNEINNVAKNTIKKYDVFPDENTLLNMPNNTMFEVKGFYSKFDMSPVIYAKRSWAANAMKIGSCYIVPLTPNYPDGVFLPAFGIQPGIDNAERNSQVMSNIMPNLKFATTLHLPDGHYYFARPLELMDSQLSLIGSNVKYSPDRNASGGTYIHFENLENGEVGILAGTSTIENIAVVGNLNDYNYTIDRENTLTNPESIENEVCNKKCYGIKTTGVIKLSNIVVRNFYYGIHVPASNTYIDNILVRNCHCGMSIGNDVKVTSLYGWNVHTLLECKGSIASVMFLRADSCHHLVHINAQASGICLGDIDGDYCLGSVVRIGNGETDMTVSRLTIMSATARHGCLKARDRNASRHDSSIINTGKDAIEYGFIGIDDKTNVLGCDIQIRSRVETNPHDHKDIALTPHFILAQASGAFSGNIRWYDSKYDTNATVLIDPTIDDVTDCLCINSPNNDSAKIVFDCMSGKYIIYKKSPSNLYISQYASFTFDPPTSSTSRGVTGQSSFDDNYLYICVADDTWIRIKKDETW